MKLGIGLPVMEKRSFNDFWVSFLMMEKPDYTLFLPKFPVGDFPENLSLVRNNLVRQALEENCTHLLMCDTDQLYERDTITKLLSHNQMVTAVVVHRRYPPFEPILNRGVLGRYTHVPDAEIESGELIEVDATGTGCILFNMEVFSLIEHPWFEIGEHNGKRYGEDIGFAHKLQQQGIPIHIDTSVHVKHLTTMGINYAFYSLYKKINNIEWGT